MGERFVTADRVRSSTRTAAVLDVDTRQWAPFIDARGAEIAADNLNSGRLSPSSYMGWRDDVEQASPDARGGTEDDLTPSAYPGDPE